MKPPDARGPGVEITTGVAKLGEYFLLVANARKIKFFCCSCCDVTSTCESVFPSLLNTSTMNNGEDGRGFEPRVKYSIHLYFWKKKWKTKIFDKAATTQICFLFFHYCALKEKREDGIYGKAIWGHNYAVEGWNCHQIILIFFGVKKKRK